MRLLVTLFDPAGSSEKRQEPMRRKFVRKACKPFAALILAGLVVLPVLAQFSRIGITFTQLAEANGAHAGTIHRVALEARLDPGFHVNSNAPLEDFLIATVMTLDPPEGIELTAVAWPEPIMLSQQGAEQPLAVFEEEFVIGAALSLGPQVAVGQYVIPGTLRYQACDESMCYLPATAPVSFTVSVVPSNQAVTSANADFFAGLSFGPVEGDPPGEDSGTRMTPTKDNTNSPIELDDFTLLGTTGGYLDAAGFIDFIDRAESGRSEQGWFEGRGPLAILALVLFGGLALNLTPCVLPLIPINLAIIGAGTRASSRMRGFTLGSIYGLAMAVVYGVLGIGVILTAGTFGTINASPWFNLAIAALFIVLALAMFDIITIDFSRFQNKFNFESSSGQGSFVIAFGMGGVSALLAGACVAPVVIQVIVFASNLYSTGTMVALALPLVLGLGMALPWPIAGAGLSIIPKPGAWMVKVKQAFGVFILGTAVYYGYLSYGLFSQRWVDPEAVANSVQELLDDGWYASLNHGLRTAKTENQLVLVDVWATWCKNCLTMDRTTLKDPAVQAALERYVKIKFQAEDPSASPAREVMDKFKGIGLPTYAILRPSTTANRDAVTVGR